MKIKSSKKQSFIQRLFFELRTAEKILRRREGSGQVFFIMSLYDNFFLYERAFKKVKLTVSLF